VSDTKPSIFKCVHGIYDPSGTGVARYCTICTEPPEISKEDEQKILGLYKELGLDDDLEILERNRNRD
jgi:hypothetical protein